MCFKQINAINKIHDNLLQRREKTLCWRRFPCGLFLCILFINVALRNAPLFGVPETTIIFYFQVLNLYCFTFRWNKEANKSTHLTKT
jgi:hypothetical protein